MHATAGCGVPSEPHGFYSILFILLVVTVSSMVNSGINRCRMNYCV